MTSSRWVAMALPAFSGIAQAERGKDGAMLAERVLAAAGASAEAGEANPLKLSPRGLDHLRDAAHGKPVEENARGSEGRGRRTPPSPSP